MALLSELPKTGESFSLIARTVDDTRQIGKELGGLVHPGAVICLVGDLGSGKTTFVQGLARGLDVPQEYYVTSPSYTLVNEYPGRLPLYHLDLYRLSDSEDVWDIGIEDILAARGVVAIEWPDRLPAGLIDGFIRIEMTRCDDDGRHVMVQYFKAGLGC